ncbi:MAG TPA: HAMP domain-containing sensor histidine kinase [Gammaproteobacteria bacterium]|nr:HAMP domain-containing sensor histidine kinase [Gammaproteobacteria bacterium]
MSLLASVVVPLALLSATAVYLSLGFVEHGIERRMQEDVQLVARAIRLPVSQGLAHREHGRIQETLESAFSIPKVYGAYVYDMHGRRLAAAGSVRPAHAGRHMLRLAAQRERSGEYDEVEGRRVYSYFVPLTDSGNRIIGLLQVTRRRSDFDVTLTRLRIGAGIVILSMLTMIAGIVLIGHQRAIGRHLAGLAGVMQRVRGGERERRAATAGPREVAAVADSLNTMLDSIAAAERELAARRQIEADLSERLRQAEKLAMLGRFAAGVAHELGAPLSVIDGKARRLSRKDAAASARELETIRAEVARAGGVIRQILELARHGPARRRRESCAKLAHDAAAAVNDIAQAAGTAINVRAGPTGCTVGVEPLRIRQAFVNLLRNAVRATPGGRVELQWERVGDRVQFSIEDDGPGIPPALRERVFEPFFTASESGGTGLGLALTQSIVLDHDGRIDVVACRSGGACFRIDLPLMEPV